MLLENKKYQSWLRQTTEYLRLVAKEKEVADSMAEKYPKQAKERQARIQFFFDYYESTASMAAELQHNCISIQNYEHGKKMFAKDSTRQQLIKMLAEENIKLRNQVEELRKLLCEAEFNTITEKQNKKAA